MIGRALATVLLVAVAAPSAESDSATVSTLAGRLSERVVSPAASQPVAVLSESDPRSVLDRGRLDVCLATVAEADAWPDVWLIVQDEGVDWDLVVHLRREPDGTIVDGDIAALERADWDPKSLKSALREALGGKPRAKVRDIVVQGFRTRTVTLYPYESSTSSTSDRGLIALLPDGAILREARTVDLADGHRHTLALVLREARFEPADCSTALGETYGHLDRGRIDAVLVGGSVIEDAIELTPYLRLGDDGALPRYRCASGESPDTLEPDRVRDWIRSRTPIPLLDPSDLDGDGRALEVRLPAPTVDGSSASVVLRVDPTEVRLRVDGRDRGEPPSAPGRE